MREFTKQAQQEQGHNKQTFGTSATDEFKECNTRVSANKIWTICKRLAAWNAQTKVYNTQVSMSEGKLQLWKIMFSGDGQRKVNSTLLNITPGVQSRMRFPKT